MTARKANYRPLPVKKTASKSVQDTKKRKRINKSRPIDFFQSSESEEDNPDGLSDDGSSSGDSVSDSVPAHAKRPRTSRILTRSSNRAPAPDAVVEAGQIVTSQALASTTQLLPVVPNADAPSLVDKSLTDTTIISINSQVSHPVDPGTTSPVDNSDTDNSLSRSVPRASSGTLSNPGDTSPAETQVTRDTDIPPVADAIVSPDTDTEVSTAITTRVTAGATTEVVVGATPSVGSLTITPAITPHSLSPLILTNDIDIESVPAFLRSHGKGKREVNIFNYLDKVKNPRFRQLLYHYIQLEAGDKSRAGGSLPTAKRPIEVSQWSSRARPDTLPDFTKGKRTFLDFVDSTLTWWGCIQPDWRTFEHGKVSREVCGDWDVLYAPRINGLLNVVILAYWWARVLEEQKPKDAVHADYEQFADDVAWVFSNLSS